MRDSDVYLPCEKLEERCRFETLRRSGPGGQNRNKVETGARFYHLSTGLVGEATERRYQGVNRRVALERLRLKLALTQRAPVELLPSTADLPERPRDYADFHWYARLQGDKIRAATDSFDFPILVAEFFDVYAACENDLRRAATVLRTTPSQIVRLLASCPQALERLNVLREQMGAKRLTP